MTGGKRKVRSNSSTCSVSSGFVFHGACSSRDLERGGGAVAEAVAEAVADGDGGGPDVRSYTRILPGEFFHIIKTELALTGIFTAIYR